LEYGGEYFNVKTFPEGEAKTALLRVMNKTMGKRVYDGSGPVEKPKKKKGQMEEPSTSGPALGRVPVSSSLVDGLRALNI
jgi:hypothetical protein